MIRTMKNGGKRLTALLLLAFICINMFFPIVPANAGIMNKKVWYIQMSVDTSSWTLAGGVITETVSRFGGTSKEGKRLTSTELSDILTNPETLCTVDILTSEREENNDNKSGLVLTYPSDISSFVANSATLTDKDSAEAVLSSLLYDFNNAFTSIYNTSDIQTVAEFVPKIQELITNANGGTITCDPGTGYSKVDIGPTTVTNFPAGMSADNYRLFTFTKSSGGTESVNYCISCPKNVPDANSDTITWGVLAAEAFVNYACGVEASTVYSGDVGLFEELLVGFLGSCIDWAAGALGLWSFDEMMFNSGIRGGAAYAYGIFPIAWQSTIWTFFFISELIAVAMLLFCIINNVVRKAMSTINPIARANAMSQLMDILKVVALLVMFPFILQLGMSLSAGLAKLFGAAVGEQTAKNTFGSLLQGTGGIGGIITAALYLGALIYFNAYYFMRSVIVAFLMILGPIAIAMIGISEEYKKYYHQWAAGIISYIAIQPIHAIILAVLLLMPSTGRAIEKIVAVYALIPIGKMAKGMLLPDGSADIASGAGDAAKQKAGDMARSAVNVAATAAAVGAGMGMAKDQERLRQEEQAQQEEQRQADGGVGNNFNQNKYNPDKPKDGQQAGGQSGTGTGDQSGAGGSGGTGGQEQNSEQQQENQGGVDPLSQEALNEGGGPVEERAPAGGPSDGGPDENGAGSGTGSQVGQNVESSQRGGAAATAAGATSGGTGTAGERQDTTGQGQGEVGKTGDGQPDSNTSKQAEDLAGDLDPTAGPQDDGTQQPQEGQEEQEGQQPQQDGQNVQTDGGEVQGDKDKEKQPGPLKKVGQALKYHLYDGTALDGAISAAKGMHENRKAGQSLSQSALNAVNGDSDKQRAFQDRKDERERNPKRIAARNMRRAAASFAVGGALSIATGGRAGTGLLFMSQRTAATAASMSERAKAYEARQGQINQQMAAQQEAAEQAARTAEEQRNIPHRNFIDPQYEPAAHDPTEGMVSDPNAKDVIRTKEQAQEYGIDSLQMDARTGSGQIVTNENLDTTQKANLAAMAETFQSGSAADQAALRESGYQHVTRFQDASGEHYRVKLNSNYEKGAGGGVGAKITGKISGGERGGGEMEVRGYTSGAPLFQSVDSCKQAYRESVVRQPATLNTTPQPSKGVSVTKDQQSGQTSITYKATKDGTFNNITEAGSFKDMKNTTVQVPTGKTDSQGQPTMKQEAALTGTFTPTVGDGSSAESLASYASTFERAAADTEKKDVQLQQDVKNLNTMGIYDVKSVGDGSYSYTFSPEMNEAMGGGRIELSQDGKSMSVTGAGGAETMAKCPIIPHATTSQQYAELAKQKTKMQNRSGYANRQGGGKK